MQLRTLHANEREALLELLDGFEMADGWRGRDFFRRYLESDPSYRDDQVHVAVEGGRLLSCVQIFPRRLRLAGQTVPCGGIGSVFTRADSRRRGLAEALLARAVLAMQAQDMELSLLFASRIPWYTKLGWRSLERRRGLYERPPTSRPAPPELEIAAFDRVRDLAALRALHERFCANRDGSVVRDDALWEGSLHVAGNPGEEILVARRGGELVAYARACALYGMLTITEWAHAPHAEPALAALGTQLAAPREPDPLVERAGARPDARAQLLWGDLEAEPAFAAALAAEGFRVRWLPDREAMLRCIAPRPLAARLGIEAPEPDADPGAWLARQLPPARFRFWVADRF